MSRTTYDMTDSDLEGQVVGQRVTEVDTDRGPHPHRIHVFPNAGCC